MPHDRPDRNGNDPAPTERGLDRLIGFTDAVVAIALTLIVLPLVDGAFTAPSTVAFFQKDGPHVVAAALSFVIIGLFWREHHAEMERAGRYDRLLVDLSLLWMATIVFLPVPTALLFDAQSDDLLGADIYIATMLTTMVTIRLIQTRVARCCTAEGLQPLPRWRLAIEWVPAVLMAIALGLSAVGLGTRALVLLLLAFPAQVVVRRLHDRVATPRASA